MNAKAMAAFLGWFQQPGRNIPICAAEALLWIAAGEDSLAALQQHMGSSPRAVERAVSLLRGRARYREGKWIESPYGLVMVRKHPNRRGNQLLLTPEGHQLIRMYFGADALPSTATPVQPAAALP
jgi:hypothetical protein